jgi:hypothetical protein
MILPIRPLRIKSALNLVSQEAVDNGIGQLVEQGFNSIEAEYDSLAAKMLVAVRGSRQIEILLESEEFTRLIEKDVNILTVHSRPEYTTHNGEQITRSEFDSLKDTLGGDASVKLIIVHYDILAEGIDVPGLLGVLILRNMKEAKFLQTIGRVVRVYRKNPELKREGLLLVPEIADYDMSENFKMMISRIFEEGYMPKQLLNDYLTLGNEEEVDELDQFEAGSFTAVQDSDLHLYTASMDIQEVADF